MITVDAQSSVPPFEQVRRQLAAQIGDGTLPVGTRLPPVRRLADDLGLAANTVARSYRELEAAGLVETRGRGGTVVRGADPALARVHQAARDYADAAHAAGLDRASAEQIVHTALDPEAVRP